MLPGMLVEVPYLGEFSLRDTLKSGQIFHWESCPYEGMEGFAGCIGGGAPAFVVQEESGIVRTLPEDVSRVS